MNAAIKQAIAATAYNAENDATACYFSHKRTHASAFTGSSATDFSGNDNHAALTKSACLQFNGTTQYISVPSLVGTETVVSSGGTATPSIVAGRINFTAGTAHNVLLSNGSHYPISSGAGNAVYDVVNFAHGGTVNAPTWATQDVFHWNLLNGFDVGRNLLKHSANMMDAVFEATGATKINSNTVSFGANTDRILQQIAGSAAGLTVKFSVFLAGSGSVRLQISNFVDNATALIVINLTGVLTRHSITHTFNNTATASWGVVVRGADGTFPNVVTVTNWQAQTGVLSAYQPTLNTNAIGAKIPATASGLIPSGLNDRVSNPAGGHNGAETKIVLPFGGGEWTHGDAMPAGWTSDTNTTPSGVVYRNFRK